MLYEYGKNIASREREIEIDERLNRSEFSNEPSHTIHQTMKMFFLLATMMVITMIEIGAKTDTYTTHTQRENESRKFRNMWNGNGLERWRWGRGATLYITYDTTHILDRLCRENIYKYFSIEHFHSIENMYSIHKNMENKERSFFYTIYVLVNLIVFVMDFLAISSFFNRYFDINSHSLKFLLHRREKKCFLFTIESCFLQQKTFSSKKYNFFPSKLISWKIHQFLHHFPTTLF